LISNRFYHFGCDKPDNVDEIGMPVPEECADDSFLLNDDACQLDDFNDDCCSDKHFLNESDFVIPTEIVEPEEEKEQQPMSQEEGISTSEPVETTFPQILPESVPTIDDPIVNSIHLKRSDSALNIFDQTTILKLFSARNWTETFFNRIFRKKFLVLSPGDDALVAFKNGFDIEQQLMHISHKYPRDFSLPAIVPERDKKLTNGLLPPNVLIQCPNACWTKP